MGLKQTLFSPLCSGYKLWYLLSQAVVSSNLKNGIFHGLGGWALGVQEAASGSRGWEGKAGSVVVPVLLLGTVGVLTGFNSSH